MNLDEKRSVISFPIGFLEEAKFCSRKFEKLFILANASYFAIWVNDFRRHVRGCVGLILFSLF